MVSTNWQDLFASLNVYLPEGVNRIGPPTSDDLDSYEQRNEFRLPTSYRDYILVFGPGELGCRCEIRSPGFPWAENYDLQKFHCLLQTPDEFYDESYADHIERVRRLHLFASDGDDVIGWDPLDICDRTGNEYAIFRLETASPKKIASTFEEFVIDYCLTESPEWPDDELGPQRSFDPAHEVPGWRSDWRI